MRALVDIGEMELKTLDRLARRNGVSRASLIREAVSDFIARHDDGDAAEAFGLWGDRKIDGLAYQDDIRSEW